MSQIFRQHLEKFIKVSDDQFNEIMGYFETRIVVKKENVLVKGKICKHHFFVLEGLLRKFYINEKEAEQTVEFAIETWWITDNIAYERRAKTQANDQYRLIGVI
ncbi:hypothetical protein H9N25_05735 [Pedobacter riviphilus]|uniref:Cyclic nucleotide-binding domain-containing protein n=1 Tax=Pedobacter riviphilus TaxID=2766984 RepID=A0ABX6TKE9_9SPHI|nr:MULTISPECIES: hypothetical protein [Pedobacter]NII82154.1 hypothetical protein [Pedobacter sp. SG908]NMN36172.1 hypothetical protein [Pedobacter sp. SG918]QNR85943.1 hypothetical protein H9N25_05735 [Pedobacter riviphilus]